MIICLSGERKGSCRCQGGCESINRNEEIGSGNLQPRQHGQEFLLPSSFRSCSEGSALSIRDLIWAIELLFFLRTPTNMNVQTCFPHRKKKTKREQRVTMEAYRNLLTKLMKGQFG